MSKIIGKAVSLALVGILGCGSLVAMTGCDAVRDVVGSAGPIGQSATSSKNTKSSDRSDCWGTVEDIDGNKYATVIYMQPMDGTKFSPDTAKQVLSQSNINWYQMITSDAMGTNKQEYGMVYFPASVTLADMTAALNILSGVYDAHIMTKDEYEKYLADSPTDQVWDIQIYGKETTHYGPAAQQSKQ